MYLRKAIEDLRKTNYQTAASRAVLVIVIKRLLAVFKV